MSVILWGQHVTLRLVWWEKMGSWVRGPFCFGVGWGVGGWFVVFGQEKCVRVNRRVVLVSDADDSLGFSKKDVQRMLNC